MADVHTTLDVLHACALRLSPTCHDADVLTLTLALALAPTLTLTLAPTLTSILHLLRLDQAVAAARRAV